MVRRSVADLAQSPNLPCILVLKNNLACILRKRTKLGIEVVFPETPDAPVEVSLKELEENDAMQLD